MSKIIVRRQEYANNGTHANEIEAVVKENLIANTLSGATDIAPSVGLLKSVSDGLTYKQGDTLIIHPTYKLHFAGRLGWGRTRFLCTIPLDKEITHFSGITVSQSSGVIYATDDFRNCTLSYYGGYYNKNLLSVAFDITPQSAWSSSQDCMAICELGDSFTMTVNF